MAKQINFLDIYTISINIVEQDDAISIELVYGLEDDEGEKWPIKRLQIAESELTANQISKIQQVISAAENKAKAVEGI